MWIANSARFKKMDQLVAESGASASLKLMERAGAAAFEELQKWVPRGRLVVFCGRGGNGGDGFVVARLAHQAGYLVSVFVAATEKELGGDTLLSLQAMRRAGLEPLFYGHPAWKEATRLCLSKADGIVDALLGISAHGSPEGAVLESILLIQDSRAPVMALDVPSGVEADTGIAFGQAVKANHTVTFGLPKPFLFQGEGLELAGDRKVAEIGYPKDLLATPSEARLLDGSWAAAHLPKRPRNSHKGDNGHVLVLAGSDTYRGAAALTALGALRAGAGLVTLAASESVCASVAAQIPEVIFLPLHGSDLKNTMATLLEAIKNVDSLVIGPGLGQSPEVSALLKTLFRKLKKPACLDADALNVIAGGVPMPSSSCVLTPHPGELSRLLGKRVQQIQAERFASAIQAAKQFNQTVLLKGAYSLVSAPEMPLHVCATGNPGMASAGMGDVLAGMVGALLAQELSPYAAASSAMVWHGFAGDLCAQEMGPVGFLASDVANGLPRARAKLGSQ